MRAKWGKCVAAVAVLAGAAAYVPGIADAAQAASIVLRGYIPEVSSIRLASFNPVVSSNLREPLQNALVARFLEQSNSQGGYRIKVSSSTARDKGHVALVNSQTGTAIPYSVSYGGKPLDFKNGIAEVNRPRGAARGAGLSSDLTISSNVAEPAVSGEYVDIITIGISAR